MASMGVLRFHQINVMPHIISFSTLLAPVHISLISNVEIIVMTKKGIADQWMILSILSATLKMSATTLLIMSDTTQLQLSQEILIR